VLTAYGQPVLDTTVSIGQIDVHTDQAGVFAIRVAAGSYELRVRTPHNAYRSLPITVHQDQSLEIKMPVSVSVIVRAGATAEILTADPATEAYDRKDLIAANPGRPGVPFAVPGYPPKQPREGSKRHNTSRLAWQGTTASHRAVLQHRRLSFPEQPDRKCARQRLRRPEYRDPRHDLSYQR
jgi:hypothetical protein